MARGRLTACVSVIAPAPGTAIRWPLLLVLASLAAVAPVATDLYLPGFPAMGDDLGADASGVQLTLTSFLVGLAFGQLVMGPLSDRFGRRTPLLVSAGICVVAGVVCATAPSLAVLVVARLVQGFAGAGGMVIGRAVIADVVTGQAAARAFTLMLTVGGVAPVLAPLVGGLLADPVGWSGMLWTVAALCLAMLVGVLVVVGETHPVERRRRDAMSSLAAIRTVVANRAYRGPVAVFALSFGVMMAYISASPFVYQNVLGLSEIGYGVAFGINAGGLIGAGWVTSRLIDRWSPRRSRCRSVRAWRSWSWRWPVRRPGPTPPRSSSPSPPTARSWATPLPWRWRRFARPRVRGAQCSASPSSPSAPSSLRSWASAGRPRRSSRPS